MKKTIIKGFHRPFQLIPACFNGFGLVRHGSYVMERTVTFTESCRHDLGDVHQQSWSKLFGFCFGFFGIHKKSYRFGWRYNTETGMIEIARIIYDGGERIMKKICQVAIGEPYTYRIECDIFETTDFEEKMNIHWFVNCMRSRVLATYDAPKSRHRFGCGLYFGGQRPAPKTMTIEISKGYSK